MNAWRQPVIAGVGETEYSRASGRSELQLAAEAGLAAIRDAGLEPGAVDGLVSYTMDASDELELQRCLGMPLLRWSGRAPFGGLGCTASVQIAAAAVAAGYAEAVLVWRALNGRSGRRYGTPESSKAVGSGGRLHYAMGLDTGAKSYAAEMQGWLRKRGVTSEDLGRYVVATRSLAATNPRAMLCGQPLTLDEHQASRWIVEPWLRRWDCCLESDGGAALLVTSAALAPSGVHIAAAAQAHGIGRRIAYDVYRGDDERAAEQAALVTELVRQSGLHPREADVAMLYDAFSPAAFVQLEDFGLCGPGEARDFVATGETLPGGRMPVNPNGGLLGEAYMHGLNNVIEAVRQLRGDAANPVADARVALVTGGGALMLTRS
ncbi:MAG: lipid-transfer protein [Sphingomonadales bacterium]|nr:lipid-transfer protein [Sphingomonadales bacterium]